MPPPLPYLLPPPLPPQAPRIPPLIPRDVPPRAATTTAQNDRPAKRTKFDFQEELTVLVGESEQKFILHKAIICKSSEFFKASLSSQWKEGQENIVRLPDCTAPTFNTYLGWLYTDVVDLFEEDERELPWIDKDGTTLTLRLRLTRRAIDCYALGDILLDSGFANAVVDELIKISDKCNTIPGHQSITYAWEKIPHDSKMADLLVDLHATSLSKKEFDAFLPHLPTNFVVKIARAGIRDRYTDVNARKPVAKVRCHYHRHNSTKEDCMSEKCTCAECLVSPKTQ